jgi:hypothetical protein
MAKKSHIAGILDAHGGLRVVVGTRSSIYANYSLSLPEKLFILPGVLVEEPVPWDQVPWTIRRVELYIEWWCRTRNDPDDLNHIAIQRYISRLKNPEDRSLHIAGYLEPPR